MIVHRPFNKTMVLNIIMMRESFISLRIHSLKSENLFFLIFVGLFMRVIAYCILSGRRLLERAKTTDGKGEDAFAQLGRKSRTAGSRREFPDLRHTASASVRPPTSENDVTIPAVDSNGILHFPDVITTSQALFDVRPVSPPKTTVDDGVTDVIRVHITSSAKY